MQDARNDLVAAREKWHEAISLGEKMFLFGEVSARFFRKSEDEMQRLEHLQKHLRENVRRTQCDARRKAHRE